MSEGPEQGAVRGSGSSARAGQHWLFWRWPDKRPSGTKTLGPEGRWRGLCGVSAAGTRSTPPRPATSETEAPRRRTSGSRGMARAHWAHWSKAAGKPWWPRLPGDRSGPPTGVGVTPRCRSDAARSPTRRCRPRTVLAAVACSSRRARALLSPAGRRAAGRVPDVSVFGLHVACVRVCVCRTFTCRPYVSTRACTRAPCEHRPPHALL